jgi:hypothetical protein
VLAHAEPRQAELSSLCFVRAPDPSASTPIIALNNSPHHPLHYRPAYNFALEVRLSRLQKLTAPYRTAGDPAHRHLPPSVGQTRGKGKGALPSHPHIGGTSFISHIVAQFGRNCTIVRSISWGSLYHGTRTTCCCTRFGEQGLNKRKAEQTPKLSHLSHPVLSQLRICQRRSEYKPSRISTFFSGFGFPAFRSGLVRISSDLRVCTFASGLSLLFH